jgi:hypothetical protein
MLWPFGFRERRGSPLACRLAGKLNGVKCMIARQENRPEEIPFDEPVEEPPAKLSPYAEPSPEDDPGRPVDPQPSSPPEFLHQRIATDER